MPSRTCQQQSSMLYLNLATCEWKSNRSCKTNWPSSHLSQPILTTLSAVSFLSTTSKSLIPRSSNETPISYLCTYPSAFIHPALILCFWSFVRELELRNESYFPHSFTFCSFQGNVAQHAGFPPTGHLHWANQASVHVSAHHPLHDSGLSHWYHYHQAKK